MKKSGIALLLTVALTLGTILGCFTLTAGAAESASSSASVVSVDASVVGAELQVAINASGDVQAYKLYEMGSPNACVAEGKYPIIAYAKYDSSKTYGVSVVDADGAESAITTVTGINAPAVDTSYDPSNILAGKPFEMASYAKRFAHTAPTVTDWSSMTDGNLETRYSTGGNATDVIDGIVLLGGVYSLGELRLYDFNGVASHAGSHIAVEVYTDGRWVKAAELNSYDELLASMVGSGQKVGYISINLCGYNAEAIRIFNDGKRTDAMSYWEITLSGVKISSYSSNVPYVENLLSNYYYDTYEESNDLLNGLVFERTENDTSSDPSSTAYVLANITDSSHNTAWKVGGLVELEVSLNNNCDYVILDTVTITYQQNTGGGNTHYVRGEYAVISVYFAGEWKDVYTEIFSTDDYTVNYNCPTLEIDLGGIPAEKLRFRSFGKTLYINSSGVNSIEQAVGICDINATGAKITCPTDLTVSDDVLLGNLFVPSASTANTIWKPIENMTDGNHESLYATAGQTAIDATLDFHGVALLNELTVNYEAAYRCGKNIVIEVTYNGDTYTVVNHNYTEAVTGMTFNLGGVLAEKIRISVVAGEFPGLNGNCTSIRDLICTGAISTTYKPDPDVDVCEYDNVLADKTMTKGPAGTSVNLDIFDYFTLTDGSKSYNRPDQNKPDIGRFSTTSCNYNSNVKLVVMDANISLDSSLDLGELRLYDYQPENNIFAGNSLQIIVFVKGVWRILYDYDNVDDIYFNNGHRVGSYLSFDLGGVNASALRIIARQTTDTRSVSLYEIELSASWTGYEEERAAAEELKSKEYAGGNILEGIPAENISASHGMNASYPLTNAFDGIIDPSNWTHNRYAMGSVNKVTDAAGNHIANEYNVTIDLVNPTGLYDLCIYDWRGGDTQTRSNKTTVEVMVDGNWITLYKNVPLTFGTNAGEDHTEFDLGGITATAIRLTFRNDNYSTSTEKFAVATIKEITCTGALSYGDVLDAIENVESIDTTEIFGMESVKDKKLAAIAADLVLAGATSEEILARIAELNAIKAELEAGYEPVTDRYGDFTTFNVSLAGNVGFNFYGDLADDVLTQFPNASVVVRYDTVLDGVVNTVEEERSLADLAIDTSGRHIVAFDMAAAQMTDTVEIRLVLDGENCGKYIKTSIKEYAEQVLAGNYDEGFKSIVSAMLTYGAYAQSYFGYNTDNLAADITADLGSVSDSSSIRVEGTASGMSMSGWTLMLDSNVNAKIYVKLADGASPEDYTVTVTTPAGEVIAVDALEAVGNRYRVTVTDITSGYLNNDYVVTYTNVNDGTTMTVTSSAMCYVSAILASDTTDEALINLVKALKLYSNAADAYFGK